MQREASAVIFSYFNFVLNITVNIEEEGPIVLQRVKSSDPADEVSKIVSFISSTYRFIKLTDFRFFNFIIGEITRPGKLISTLQMWTYLNKYQSIKTVLVLAD